MQLKDEELVQATLAGDLGSFGVLYDRYAGVVRAIAFEATGSVADAQDLAQEAFLRAFQKLADLRDPAAFGPWLIGIARLSGKQWQRTQARRRRRMAGELDCDLIATNDAAPEPPSDLHEALVGLSESERIALHLFYFDEQPAERARRLMGLSLSGFYRVLDRARRRLRRRLAENVETES